ncbi:MAG: two-component system, NtrC family, response regulator AtoC [Solirubrobacteraceae bacterium]|jgi:transcriptional regulator with GAF, ATPase, and Fis domain|nr:two-component system, NtrC family, response regulator AtoC [Solirubrobacteraceae bacterium]
MVDDRRETQVAAPQQPWLIVAAPDPAASAEAVQALGSFLRVADPANPPTGDGPGAIVFDTVDDALLGLARDTTHAGRRRVLGVAMAPEPLDGTDTWRLLREGLADIVAWEGPAAIRARIERWQAVDELVASSLVAEHLVGSSAAWRSVLRDVVEIAYFSDVDVLITGESGTGKELTAQLIHTLDQRPNKGNLVVVDCTTIVPSLSGSEFFGHERGAFTGAVAARDGAFALADGGTLFLDEVGELPLALQAELLRAVQEGTYKRVGSNRWQRAKFRLVCATNRDLPARCEDGAFRADLFFRLAAATIEMPPLRERPEDILSLARHFMVGGDRAPPPLSPPVRDLLQARDYPGNVRDLKQLMARIGLRHVGPGAVTAGDVPPSERPLPGAARGWEDDLAAALRRAVALGVPLREIVDAARTTAISLAVSTADGSLRHAATRLGVTDRTLQMHRARRRDEQRAG